MALPNLIVAGSYRAGTTSLFTYLSRHPQVCGSSVKETAFFIRDYSGDRECDEAALGAYFGRCAPDARIRVEGSAGYLQEAALVAPRIKSLLDNPKIVFMLRCPADRLYSYFNYLVGQLRLPATLSFEDYVAAALDYDSGGTVPGGAPYSESQLEALVHGKYSSYLEVFYSTFGSGSVKSVLFENLNRDPRSFMLDMAAFLGIGLDFYATYSFGKVNASFLSRYATLHRAALFANRSLEPFLRQRPGLKTPLVALYKRFNMAREGYAPMSADVRRRLFEYYSDDVARVEALVGTTLPASWREP